MPAETNAGPAPSWSGRKSGLWAYPGYAEMRGLGGSLERMGDWAYVHA